MKKINAREIAEEEWFSPKGKYASFDINLSEALGREKESTDLLKRHPFDVEICRVPPGKTNCPFHSHSAQWEFYHILSGTGKVRHDTGTSSIGPGDTFLFKPGEAHQLINDGAENLVFFLVADNPLGESCHYPDSGKWMVRSPERRLVRSDKLDYWDGEE